MISKEYFIKQKVKNLNNFALWVYFFSQYYNMIKIWCNDFNFLYDDISYIVRIQKRKNSLSLSWIISKFDVSVLSQ